eukprot:COSAG01_NODE_6113_length_3843_cov_5.851763_1_plen_206_part_00
MDAGKPGPRPCSIICGQLLLCDVPAAPGGSTQPPFSPQALISLTQPSFRRTSFSSLRLCFRFARASFFFSRAASTASKGCFAACCAIQVRDPGTGVIESAAGPAVAAGAGAGAGAGGGAGGAGGGGAGGGEALLAARAAVAAAGAAAAAAEEWACLLPDGCSTSSTLTRFRRRAIAAAVATLRAVVRQQHCGTAGELPGRSAYNK